MKNLLKVKVNCLKCGKEMEEIERVMNYDSGDVYVVVLKCCGKEMLVESRFLDEDEEE